MGSGTALKSQDAIEQAKADGPVAIWDFEEGSVRAGAIGKVESVSGPTKRDSHTLPEKNHGIALYGDGGRIEVPDNPELRFDQGETITIEAWARTDRIDRGGNVYLVGKGRSTSRMVIGCSGFSSSSSPSFTSLKTCTI